MCMDPITMMMIGSTALGALGSVMEGNAANEAAKMQQAAYNQQAQADAQASAFEVSREKYKQELAASSARAQIGASGVALTGSPTDVLVAQAGQGELDLQAIKYGSQMRQNQLITQGKISAYQGKQAKIAGFIGAGTKILSGAVQIGKNPFASSGHKLYG